MHESVCESGAGASRQGLNKAAETLRKRHLTRSLIAGRRKRGQKSPTPAPSIATDQTVPQGPRRLRLSWPTLRANFQRRPNRSHDQVPTSRRPVPVAALLQLAPTVVPWRTSCSAPFARCALRLRSLPLLRGGRCARILTPGPCLRRPECPARSVDPGRPAQPQTVPAQPQLQRQRRAVMQFPAVHHAARPQLLLDPLSQPVAQQRLRQQLPRLVQLPVFQHPQALVFPLPEA